MSGNQFANEVTVAIAKASPALAVVGTGVTGTINWTDVAYGLTAAYMLLQIILLIPKYRDMFRNWKQKP